MKSKKELKEKAEFVKDLIEGIVDETIDIPDKALVTSDYKTFIQIFTQKRLELIDCINRYQPLSIQQLADITKRKKQAVDRDLKILENYEVIELIKEGRNVVPIVKREILLFNLKKPEQKIQEEIIAEVYINDIPVNEKMIEVIPTQ